MSDIRIEPFQTEMTVEASRALASAFVTNPLHVRVFGPNQLARNEAFFRTGLAAMRGPKVVAMDNSQILGLLHWVRSPECQVPQPEKLRMVPGMVRGCGVGSSLRIVRWLSVWSAHDPKEPHLHLGPIAVNPKAQHRGIGRRLMERYCEELDRTGQAGYLETDRPENVKFYRRFGFEVTLETPVLGIPNYFMLRKTQV